MVRIQSIEEYKSLIKENKKEFPVQDKNSILLPDAMSSVIREGRAFAEKASNGLYILVDEDSYYSLHYFIKRDDEFDSLQADKPVIFDEMGLNGSRDGYLQTLEKRIGGAGFRPFRKTLQLVRELSMEDMQLQKAAEEGEKKLNSQGLTIFTGIPEERIGDITGLWELQLNFGDIAWDHYHFYGKEKYLLVSAVDGSGKIAGSCLCEITGRNSSVGWHVVTHPDFLRRGIAAALLFNSMAELARSGITRHFTWIHTDNDSSFALHHKVGFAENGRECSQFIADWK